MVKCTIFLNKFNVYLNIDPFSHLGDILNSNSEYEPNTINFILDNLSKKCKVPKDSTERLLIAAVSAKILDLKVTGHSVAENQTSEGTVVHKLFQLEKSSNRGTQCHFVKINGASFSKAKESSDSGPKIPTNDGSSQFLSAFTGSKNLWKT